MSDPTFWGPGRPTKERRKSCVAYTEQKKAPGGGGNETEWRWLDNNCRSMSFGHVCAAEAEVDHGMTTPMQGGIQGRNFVLFLFLLLEM